MRRVTTANDTEDAKQSNTLLMKRKLKGTVGEGRTVRSIGPNIETKFRRRLRKTWSKPGLAYDSNYLNDVYLKPRLDDV